MINVEQDRMDYEEMLRKVMEPIGHWAKEKNPQDVKRERGGPFKFLKEDFLIRDIAITSGKKCCVQTLKMYMATEVLELMYSEGAKRAKQSYATLEKILSKEIQKQKYKKIYLKELENCFSEEKNKEAVLRLASAGEEDKKELMQFKLIEKGEFGFFYLLEKIRSVIRKNLHKYWEMCDAIGENGDLWESQESEGTGKAKTDGGNEEQSEHKREEEKKEQYMKCLMSVALHEIYMRELAERFSRKEGGKDTGKRQRPLKAQTCGGADGKKQIERIKESWRELWMEHMFSLYAEWQLVILLERKNLLLVWPDNGVESLLNAYIKKETGCFTHPDRNRVSQFRKLNRYFENEFLSLIKVEDPEHKYLSAGIEKYLLWAGKKDEREHGKQMRAVEELVGLPVAKYLCKERRKKKEERKYYWPLNSL